ncbi:MAG: hypothetical protein ACSHYF_05045 [Verrucomicrobiaceae bacterium]
MVKRVLLFLILVGSVFGEEMEVVSYYVGKEVGIEGFKKRFGDLEKEEEFLKLEKGTFESRFFGEGDVLYGVSELFESKTIEAVFNESSGRLVVKGEQLDHWRIFEPVFYVGSAPVKLVFKGEIFEVADEGVAAFEKNPRVVPEGAKLVRGIEVCARSGEKVVTEAREMRLEVVMNVDTALQAVDSRIDLEAKLPMEGEFLLETGVTSLPGVPLVIGLGRSGADGKNYVLVVTTRVELLDGVAVVDLVIGEQDMRSTEEKWGVRRTRLARTIEIGEDRVVKVFPVPPTFMNFIEVGDGGGSNDDPFADPDEGGGEHAEIEFSKYRVSVNDPRVKWGPGERLYDLRKMLSNQGVVFREGDFAIFNGEAGALFVGLPEDQMELMDQLLRACSWVIPRLVKVDLALLENEVQTGRLGVYGRPGDKASISMGMGNLIQKAVLEPNVGANDQLLDIRFEYEVMIGERVVNVNGGTTVWSGGKQMVSRVQGEEGVREVYLGAKVIEVGGEE